MAIYVGEYNEADFNNRVQNLITLPSNWYVYRLAAVVEEFGGGGGGGGHFNMGRISIIYKHSPIPHKVCFI